MCMQPSTAASTTSWGSSGSKLQACCLLPLQQLLGLRLLLLLLLGLRLWLLLLLLYPQALPEPPRCC